MSDNLRVGIAAALGVGSPVAAGWLELEPALKVILLVGQIVVAVVTALYVFRKWRNARKK